MKQKKYSLWETIKRLTRLHLIVPLLRSPHPPEYKARGVAVGLMWSMTPLVGIQMWLVFITWITARKVFKWGFSLPLAMAWTWVSNVFTMIPCYYIFYVTGQLMRWNVESISGYRNLSHIIQSTFMSDLSFVEKWLLFFKLLLEDWGISMALGCLPWSVFLGILGYRLTLRFEQIYQAHRKAKQTIKQKTE